MDGGLYLVSCHCATGEKVEWIAAQTDADTLVKLLTNRIPIRDAFLHGGDSLFLLTLYAGQSEKTVHRVTASEIVSFLPTEGYYMESEAGEFEEELLVLCAETEDGSQVRKPLLSGPFEPSQDKD